MISRCYLPQMIQNEFPIIVNQLTESLMHLFHFAVYYSSMALEVKGEF